LRNKIDAVDEIIRANGLDLLALTETRHEDNNCIAIGRLRELQYSVIEEARLIPPSADRDTMEFINHGVVALLSTAAVRITKLNISGMYNTFEFVGGCVKSSGAPANNIVLYRPGSLPATAAFYTKFGSFLEHLSLMSLTVVITGDINIRLDRPMDAHCVQFTALLSTYGLVQRVTHSTHCLSGLLGVLIMRKGGHCEAPTVRDVGLSDHYLLQWSINITRLPPVF